MSGKALVRLAGFLKKYIIVSDLLCTISILSITIVVHASLENLHMILYVYGLG